MQARSKKSKGVCLKCELDAVSGWTSTYQPHQSQNIKTHQFMCIHIFIILKSYNFF